MNDGFLKVASCTPKIKVADPEYNADEIIRLSEDAFKQGARVIVFPELCISGYTCECLFQQETLLTACRKQLLHIAEETESLDALIFVGLPLEEAGKLYNVAAALKEGKILAFIPKTFIPNYAEFYEARYFSMGKSAVEMICFEDKEIPFGTNILFEAQDGIRGLMIGAEICEDFWAPNPPNTSHALAGANVLVNLSASNEVVSKMEYRRSLVSSTSARLLCGYIYASQGEGESTQDLVFSGHNLIAENGTILAESELFSTGILTGDLDISRIRAERRKMTTFQTTLSQDYLRIPFELEEDETQLSRKFSSRPFVPSDERSKTERCDEILTIQSLGLKKRLEHTGCKSAVIGISGGLDSTLAMLVTAKAFDLLGLNREQILCITMPCFGTTDRTYTNACSLTKAIGASLQKIDIKESVRLHFRDIGQDEQVHDVTYENGQARERTQVLMDIANKENGLVIGTGDMSELALGWATYNGDHMSMYGVNAGVPKTLVRHLVKYYADQCGQQELSRVLLDILDTPVSPELLPPEKGLISQKTEDLVGPYELHDFFLYYLLRFGFDPAKIFRIASIAFEGEYEKETIKKWLKTFYRRFFSQQFKRSCLPDGPKVGTVAVSPRGDLRMPSDASAQIWMKQLDSL